MLFAFLVILSLRNAKQMAGVEGSEDLTVSKLFWAVLGNSGKWVFFDATLLNINCADTVARRLQIFQI